MNRVILKEQSQKKEKEDSKDKKKKKIQEPIKITKEIIRHRLIVHFQNHIGERNKTTQEEIFQVVIGVNSYAVNNFAKFYFWEQIEKIIRELRRKNICFTIKKNGCYFVLKEQEEADYYKKLCDNAIEHMENAKVRADDWVEDEKWIDFEKSKEGSTEKPIEDKKPILVKTQEKKIEENIDKAKRKIIKVYKGEK